MSSPELHHHSRTSLPGIGRYAAKHRKEHGERIPAMKFFIGDSSEVRFSGAGGADPGAGKLTTTFRR